MRATFTQRREEGQDRLQWRWTLEGDNHEPLSRSTEGYDNKADAVHCFELTTGTQISSSGLTASASGGIQEIRSIELVWQPAGDPE